MRPSLGRCLSAAVPLLALLCLAGGGTAFGQEFAAAGPLHFDTPPPGDAAVKYSFTLRSTGGRLAITSLRVTEVKEPGGRALAAGQVEVERAGDAADEAGTLVSLKPPAGYFSRPGEYSVELFVEGRTPKGAQVRRTFTLLITRPAAEINLESLKNQTIELTRGYPGASASGDYALYVRETTGKSSMEDLTVEHDSVYSEKNGALSPGKVTPTPEREPGGAGGGGQWVIKLALSEFGRAGNFTSQLSVRSASFVGDKTIPLKITVKDHWALPLFVIFLGVAGSYWTNHMAENWRPRQLTRYKIVSAEKEAERLSRVVKSHEKTAQIRAVLNALRDAESENELGDSAASKVRLEEAAKALDALRLQQAKEQAAGYEALKTLPAAVELYRKSMPDLTPEEQAALDGFASALADGALQMLLSGGRVDEAGERLDEVRKGLEGLKRARLKKFAESLRSRLLRMNVQDIYRLNKVRLDARLSAAEEKIGGGDVEETKKELEAIASEVDSLADSLFEGLTDDELDGHRNLEIPSAEQERRAADFMRIRVVEGPDAWTTDAELNFVVEDPGMELRPGDDFEWRFGSVANVHTRVGKSFHSFSRPGSYTVEVDVVRDAAALRTLSLPVAVRPSQADAVLDEIGRGLKRSEIVLAAVAVALATLTGLSYFYADKPFGSLQDYLLALVWGFGIDSGVRGFAGAFKNFTRQEGK